MYEVWKEGPPRLQAALAMWLSVASDALLSNRNNHSTTAKTIRSEVTLNHCAASSSGFFGSVNTRRSETTAPPRVMKLSLASIDRFIESLRTALGLPYCNQYLFVYVLE